MYYIVNFFCLRFCVNQPKHDAGFLDSGICAGDTYLLYLVLGLSDTSCIDKAEGDTVDIDGVLDGVTGGTMNVAHNGAIILQ